MGRRMCRGEEVREHAKGDATVGRVEVRRAKRCAERGGPTQMYGRCMGSYMGDIREMYGSYMGDIR